MKRQILSLSIISIMLLSQGLCFAQNSYQFDPVLQGIPEPGSYTTQYPIPSQESYQNVNRNQVPVNNTYQPQMQDNYNYYNNDRLQGNVVMVPAKTTFNAVLSTPLS